MNEQILTAVEAALQRAEVLRSDATLLVALSGGADSVALLRAVCQLMEVHGFAVRAAHVEHGLRGEASEEDARFCQRLCAGLNIPCTVDHAGLTGGMEAGGVETRAREARYRLLLNRARECRADALLLAHHRDDQAETVLAHLIRGSGARGLGGMREQTRVQSVLVLRPLLGMPKADLLAAMEGVAYRQDESNREPCCQRNRLRAQVLPLLAAENPRVTEHIAASAQLLAMDEDVLGGMAMECLCRALVDSPPLFCVHRPPLLAAPDAVAIRALRDFVALGTRRWQAVRASDARAGLPPSGASAPGGETQNQPKPTPHPALEGEQSLSAGDSLRLLRLLRTPGSGSMNLPHGLRLDATPHCLHLVRMADGHPITPLPAPLAVELAPLCDPPLRNLATQPLASCAKPGALPCGDAPVLPASAQGMQPQALSPAAPPPEGSQPYAKAPRPAPFAPETAGQVLCGERLTSRAVRFGEWTFRLTPFDPALDPAPDGRNAIAVPDALLARATLRTARAGDQLRPFGAPGNKPLRRYFTDRHIDPPFRPVIPLICLGRHVLWAVGVGASESTRLTGARATRITVEGDAPWMEPFQDGLKTEKETPTGRSMPV